MHENARTGEEKKEMQKTQWGSKMKKKKKKKKKKKEKR